MASLVVNKLIGGILVGLVIALFFILLFKFSGSYLFPWVRGIFPDKQPENRTIVVPPIRVECPVFLGKIVDGGKLYKDYIWIADGELLRKTALYVSGDIMKGVELGVNKNIEIAKIKDGKVSVNPDYFMENHPEISKLTVADGDKKVDSEMLKRIDGAWLAGEKKTLICTNEETLKKKRDIGPFEVKIVDKDGKEISRIILSSPVKTFYLKIDKGNRECSYFKFDVLIRPNSLSAALRSNNALYPTRNSYEKINGELYKIRFEKEEKAEASLLVVAYCIDSLGMVSGKAVTQPINLIAPKIISINFFREGSGEAFVMLDKDKTNLQPDKIFAGIQHVSCEILEVYLDKRKEGFHPFYPVQESSLLNPTERSFKEEGSSIFPTKDVKDNAYYQFKNFGKGKYFVKVICKDESGKKLDEKQSEEGLEIV